MKENRFKVINAIKYKIVADILVAFMFCMCVIGIVGTIQYCVEYDVKEEIYSISGFLFACFICAVLCTFSYQRTDRYLLDVLFWDVQRTGWISGGHVRVESLISGPAQSIIGKKIHVDFDNEKSMDFSLYKRIVQIPEAEKLQIFYLKRSKVVIDIITEGVEQVQLIDEKAEATVASLPKLTMFT